jgi:hypothetical protein
VRTVDLDREEAALRAEDAITRQIIAPSPDLEGLWDSIVTVGEVKDRLLRHAALALAVRGRLPFTTTALHGLLLLHGPPGTGKTTDGRTERTDGRAGRGAGCLGEFAALDQRVDRGLRGGKVTPGAAARELALR